MNYLTWLSKGASLYFSQLDRSRRWLARQLAEFGLGAVETPFQIIFSEPGIGLRSYRSDWESGPVMLIVPAPIKSASIWDLSPSVSVVRHCLRAGLQIYLIEWEPPGEAQRDFGLSEYADRLILDCLEQISLETGQSQIFLAGHSLGGTLAAIFCALHPERVKGLILLGSPLGFGSSSGILASFVAASPKTSFLTAALGNVPGSFLSIVSGTIAPVPLGFDRWLDWILSLRDRHARLTHLRVVHWTLEEMPMAQHLFEEVVEKLYREDRFLSGTLRVGGKLALPEQVTASVLSVVDARCRLVPPQSVVPFHQAIRHPDSQLLWYEGDTGVALQHVGMLVGRQAHLHIWPQAIRWIQTHS
ncbi:poly(3-hydroxyalkanoate) synthetase [Pleurocapsa sp. PCC 7327]|uniref:alpha/beta fold hydrolase n=1 Tax=Pleurocapsa sp. PCC 7327 TaxID=118163 RepID=UPI00029FF1D1|nr:alpha/beta fold hydrolase [Pleurocapsa sp. PCC 7327]AFY75869.1 poly(3-hydroxyalkanoate) synthetase [Pleurocapsa sp. PCC 7327]